MSTVHPYRRLRSSAVSSLPFGQFNLSHLSTTRSGSLFVRDDTGLPNGNPEQSLCSTLNSKVISDELNDVNLCSKLRTTNKKEHSVSVNKFLSQRAYGNRTPNLPSDFGLQHLISNSLLKEDQISLGTIDKVYTSCWLDDSSVLIGTKCSKLILIDVNTRKHHHMPVVQSRMPSAKAGGIYSIATNPSRTLLATGTTDGNDLAIYGLPSLDIQFRLENGHKDLIFDTVWLNDQFLLSSSRDSTLSLWGVVDEYPVVDPRTDLYVMETREPWIQFNFEEIDSIRCMKLMRTKNELGVLSSNCKLHSIDALTMKINKRACALTYGSDLCCLAQNEEHLYAVGSNSHIQLIDSRTFSIVSTINSRSPDCRIRSMSFNSEILTVTTGIGDILFYDVRNSKYFQNRLTKELVLLKASKGWNRPNQEHLNLNYGYFSHPDQPAIYTHAYDQGKTRLFTAGGPLQANMAGNYCSVWS